MPELESRILMVGVGLVHSSLSGALVRGAWCTGAWCSAAAWCNAPRVAAAAYTGRLDNFPEVKQQRRRHYLEALSLS